MSRRTGIIVGAVLAVVVAVVVVVVAVSSDPSPQPSADLPAAGTGGPAPAAASTTTPAGAAAVVAMGHIGDPANTFYELFARAPGSNSWTLATPPGVADNGGLVVGAATSGAMTAGFLPSADLTFSVLARRGPADASWTPGDLPGTLAPQPDALATGPDGRVAAVLVRPTGSVVGAGPDLGAWHRVATAGALAGPSSACAVTAITSVAYTSAGAPLVGTGCARSSVAGLFAAGPTGGWSLVGSPTVRATATATRVLRLQAGAAGTVALVEGTGGGATTLTSTWVGGGADPAASSPLTVPTGWSVRGTSVGGGTGRTVAVLLGSDSGAQRRVAFVGGPGPAGPPGTWTELPSPPAGTTAVATVGTDTDAFVPKGSRLTVWSTSPGAGSWTRVASQSVPIQYGSSA